MNSDGLISVSPTHHVRLAQEYHHLIHNPPGTDFVVRTIALRKAGDLPLMSAQLVIASAETRRTFPAADTYPLHFRKTYFPASLHGDPQVEYLRQLRASELLPVPPPIGWTPLTFRSCCLPGVQYQRPIIGSQCLYMAVQRKKRERDIGMKFCRVWPKPERCFMRGE